MHAVSVLLQTITLALTINALPSLGPRQNGQIVCQTTDGSPYSDDVTETINQLFGKSGSSCAQTNGHDSDCTTVATQGTAGIVVCGTNKNWDCGVVAQYADDIQNGGGCQWNSKVGGMYLIGNAKVELVHT